MTESHFSPVDQPLEATAAGQNPAILVDLERMSPNDVVVLLRDLERRDPIGRTSGYDGRYRPYTEAVARAIEHLPETNIEHARDICTAFADSHLAKDRAGANIFVRILTEASPAHGLPLWERLMRDPEPGVRWAAYTELSEHLSTEDPDEDPLRDLGISWRGAATLLNAFIEAEHGLMVAKPGELLGNLTMRRAGIQPPADPDSQEDFN